MRPAPTDACPCGRPGRAAGMRRTPEPLPYAGCCGRYIDHWDTVPAPDAESLMRSRYTAFVLERADYLRATWHASARPATVDFDPGVRWLGLDVRGHASPAPGLARVEFIARYRTAGRAVRLHEHSRFVHEAGRWFYVDGDWHGNPPAQPPR